MIAHEHGRIVEVGPWRPRAGVRVTDLRPHFLLPGFVDVHAHIPQLPVCGVHSGSLLEWLRRWVFPLEARFRGRRCIEGTRAFFREMLAHGTTAAALYTSAWPDSVPAAFEVARAWRIHAWIGPPLMDVDGYRRVSTRRVIAELEDLAALDTATLRFAVTPRFALSCTPELLAAAGDIAARLALPIQTHLAEQVEECAEVRRRFRVRDYTTVYERAGLIGPRTLLAHCVHLSVSEWRRIRAAAVAHCPTSNAFLGSGVMPWRRARGMRVGLGTDVGAGPDLSVLRVARTAWIVHSLAGDDAPTAAELLRAATLGGAEALRFDREIGSLEPGKCADVVVLDRAKVVPPGAPAFADSASCREVRDPAGVRLRPAERVILARVRARGRIADMTIQTGLLPEKYHKAMLDWQRRHFEEYDYFLANWSRFYRQPPFRLEAKLAPLKDPVIRFGKYAGRERFARAADMPEEMVMQAAKIIKAQCSTELGSIQQHRGSVHKAQDERTQFDVLRVMAEEFRHAYQMLFLLAADDWGRTGGDIARETIEQLLSMETGSHVLDAFNLYFDSFVDNIVFCALIDRVGKYQLSMQQVFAYAPMAQSMGPMLSEEAFHLATGQNPLKRWAREAARGEGNVSIPTIQKHINKWYPRGLEMFGDERGGGTNVEFSFKDMKNAEAMGKYADEVKSAVVDLVNAEVVRARMGNGISPQEAAALADRIVATGEAERGIRPEDLVFRPSEKFYRRRGLFQWGMFSVRGEEFTRIEDYLAHLRQVLPETYVTTPDFQRYVENLRKARQGQEVQEGPLPFYG
jgi:guanine deaminase